MKKMFLGLCLAFTGFSLSAQTTYYVDAVRPNDSGNGLSWATAKRSIQAAVNLAVSNSTIYVTNGLYSSFSITNDMPIRILSVGAQRTIIDGGGFSRCATLGRSPWYTKAILSGFTLTNGVANRGGGAYSGFLNRCVVIGCRATNSEPTGSINPGCGGGVYGSAVNYCTITKNVSEGQSGGVDVSPEVRHSTITYNTAALCGGGVAPDGTMIENCLIAFNTAHVDDGGFAGGVLYNCTVVNNHAKNSMNGSSKTVGGLGSSSVAINSIVWNNTRGPNRLVSNYYDTFNAGTRTVFTNSCSTSLAAFNGNIQSDPKFIDMNAGNFRLQSSSPCRDAGSNAYVPVPKIDLDWNSRIVGLSVDMGCYEDQANISFHPADIDGNLAVSMAEAINYVTGWQAGTNSMDIAVRGIYLWQKGTPGYVYKEGFSIPTCWDVQ